MSYLSSTLVRVAEQHGLIQADISRQSGLSRAHISRVYSGESKDLSDDHFVAVLKVFSADARAQAELVVARCMDARQGAIAAGTPGADLVEIRIRPGAPSSPHQGETADVRRAEQQIHLSKETEKAFAWLRSQCPVNPELEKHLVGYARMLGMK